MHFAAQMPGNLAQADFSAAPHPGKQQICGNPGVFAREAQEDVGDGRCGGAVADGGAEALLKEAFQPSLLSWEFPVRRRPQWTAAP